MSKGDGWRECVLEEVAEIIVSNVDKKTIMGETPVRLCNYMDVYSNDYISKPLDFMEATATLIEIKRFAIETGDVIITKDSETPDDIGIPSVVTGSFSNLICGYHLALLKPKKAIIDPVFLSKMISSPQIASYYGKIASGSTRFGLSNSGIAKTPLTIPPLPQQRKIAKILTTVDNLIEKTEALIAKYQSIKQGMMHDLFTRGVDAKGKLRPPQSEAPELYKQSELGWIPKEWEVERLVDASDFLDGKRVPLKQEVRDLIEGEYPYYGASGIIDFINDYIFDDELILVGEDGENVISRNLPLAFKVTGKCWVNNHAHVLKPHKNVDIDYLTEFLEALDYKNIVSGSAQPKINQQKLAKTMVVLPTLIEQIRISKLLCNISLNIKNEVLNHFKMQFLKTALMQDLLTGKVQVTPDAEDKELAHA